jgi:hypothetical protein
VSASTGLSAGTSPPAVRSGLLVGRPPWRWGGHTVELEQVVRRAIHTASHDPHSKAATCDFQRETVARGLAAVRSHQRQPTSPIGSRQASLMPATARGQSAVGRTLRQGNFDDPRTRKLLSWSPPTASSQLRMRIVVQARPPWTAGVMEFGGQLGGQVWSWALRGRLQSHMRTIRLGLPVAIRHAKQSCLS